MFEELERLISAANSVTSEFKWHKENLASVVSGWEPSDDGMTGYEKTCYEDAKLQLKLYDVMEEAVRKYVKDSMK